MSTVDRETEGDVTYLTVDGVRTIAIDDTGRWWLADERRAALGRADAKMGKPPVIGTLFKLATDPVIWLVEAGGELVEVTGKQLQSFKSFHRVCMDRCNVVYGMMTQTQWLRLLENVMQKRLVVLPAPPKPPAVVEQDEVEARPQVDIHEPLAVFLARSGSNKKELLDGKPFAKHGNIYFCLRSFQQFLEQQVGRALEHRAIQRQLTELGGGKRFFNIDNHRGVHAWFVPGDSLKQLN